MHLALGSDVGGGTGFSLLKEGLLAYFAQQNRPAGVLVRPQAGSTFEVVLRHAASAGDALAKIFTLGTPADIAAVWVAGERVH